MTYERFQDQDSRHVFEQLLRKIATYLTILEVDSEFLSIADRKKYLKDFVGKLLSKLNDPEAIDNGSFCIPLDYHNAFTFQFSTKHVKPAPVRNFDVPIFISSDSEAKYLKTVEITSDLI